MIVFQETGLVDVSGNILTDSQFLSSVKVMWYHRNVVVEFLLILFIRWFEQKI